MLDDDVEENPDESENYDDGLRPAKDALNTMLRPASSYMAN